MWVPLATLLERLPAALDAQLQRDSGLTHFEHGVLFALGSSDLTEAQTSLLNHLLATESDDELAEKMNVTPAELKARVEELMRKFNVRRRYDLVLLAHQATARAS